MGSFKRCNVWCKWMWFQCNHSISMRNWRYSEVLYAVGPPISDPSRGVRSHALRCNRPSLTPLHLCFVAMLHSSGGPGLYHGRLADQGPCYNRLVMAFCVGTCVAVMAVFSWQGGLRTASLHVSTPVVQRVVRAAPVPVSLSHALAGSRSVTWAAAAATPTAKAIRPPMFTRYTVARAICICQPHRQEWPTPHTRTKAL